MKDDLVVFTDLDATLLDHNTYSFEPALPALAFLKERGIPVILVSSKTFAEMRFYQTELGLDGYPFVVENGSAIYTQPEYFRGLGHYKKEEGFWCYQLGRSFEELVQILDQISARYQYTIKGFHNTSESEIMERTRLNRNQVKMACMRQYSVPVFYDHRAEEILRNEITNYDLGILFGGRFIHILGPIDKGEALKKIMGGYRNKYPDLDIQSIALGDSLNDFAMLRVADIPVLVQKYDGTYESRENIPEVIKSPGIGPSGWNTTVIKIIKNRGNYE